VENERIIIELMDVIVLNVLVVEGVSQPNKNTRQKFKIKQGDADPRFKTTQLKDRKAINEKVEKKKIEEKDKDFTDDHTLLR